MNILIFTQKMDSNDDVLGFFHGWVAHLARHFDKVTVVCLYQGNCNLPPNVSVYSLGKEKINQTYWRRPFNIFFYGWKFYTYIWQLRKEYSQVFVHMNQIYVLCGGVFWKLMGKDVSLWRNHPQGNLGTYIASKMAKLVFYTSPHSYTARFKNAHLMPAGIDIETFQKITDKAPRYQSLLFLGRISPIKKIDVLIRALAIAEKQLPGLSLTIVGKYSQNDKSYYESIKKLAIETNVDSIIKWESSIPNHQTPEIYNRHEIFINLTPSGSMDKTILEAMACQSLVLVSNHSFQGKIKSIFLFKENDYQDLAEKIVDLILLSDQEKDTLRQELRLFVKNNHGLEELINRLLFFTGDKLENMKVK